MKARRFGFIGGAVVATLLLSAPPANAQFGGGTADVERTCSDLLDFAAFHKCALEKMGSFTTPPRTPTGKPDFNGIWRATRIAQDIEEIMPGQYGAFPHMNSLIVEPANGKIPYLPWAAKVRIDNEKNFISPTAACLPVGAMRWSYSPVSVTGHRIVQRPNEVIFSMERLHTYRIIPFVGERRPLDYSVKMWEGDSRGQWDGDTLVIETNNILDRVWFDHIGTFVSTDVKLTERITYVDANTLHYEETVEDPKVFSQPWKIAKAFIRSSVEGMDRMDLEDTSVEYCDSEIHHFFNVGQKLWRGYDSVAPK